MSHQDLREECIKLKMLVFDLERQNRALCELFQQKLPNQPAAHYQVPHLSLPSASCGLTCPHLLRSMAAGQQVGQQRFTFETRHTGHCGSPPRQSKSCHSCRVMQFLIFCMLED